MSDATMEARLGAVEIEQARQGGELRHLRQDLEGVGRSVEGVAADVKTLLQREASRRNPPSLATVLATAGTTLGVLAACWYLAAGVIEHAPAVVSLTKRMDHAEWKHGWAARIEP